MGKSFMTGKTGWSRASEGGSSTRYAPAPTASNTFEGPKAKRCELLVRSIDPDVGGVDENHVPRLELRGGFASLVVV